MQLYPRERAFGTHWIGGWLHHRADLNDMEKYKFLTASGFELRVLSAVQTVDSRYTDCRYHGSIINIYDKLKENS
jgi:hypothetical protein